jgi:hypothetical protein
VNADSSGNHGHVLVARDGESYEAGSIRSNPGAPQVGQVFQVPLREGRPDFGALGFETTTPMPDCNPKRVKDAWKKQRFAAGDVARLWSFEKSREKRANYKDIERSDRGHEADQEQEQDHEIGR